jgi:Putative peptidoglycan binding domain
MATYHEVEQGECLSSIALQYGFSDYHTIYNHPENAEFKQKRPDPNVIYPGDEIFIPDKELKQENRGTEKKHKFKIHPSKTLLRIVVKDENEKPLGGKSYELKIGDLILKGSTNSAGLLEQTVAADVTEGTLKLWRDQSTPGNYLSWILKIGHLDPVSFATGIQARLNNLAFSCGSVDGIIGPKTKAAVRAFQEYYGLQVDGIPGPITQAKLKELHGC